MSRIGLRGSGRFCEEGDGERDDQQGDGLNCGCEEEAYGKAKKISKK